MAEKYGKKVKELLSKEIREVVSRNKGFIFSNFENIKASEIDIFRRKLKKLGSRYFVVKKAVTGIALKESGIEGFDELLKDKKSVGLSIITEDPVQIAKVMTEFAKEKKEKFNVTMGYLDGRVLTSAKIIELSQLPGREQLITMVVCAFNAPISGIVNVLAAPIRGLCTVLNAIKEKK